MTDNLTAALAAVQADLPTIGKEKTAKVDMKTGGSYKYSYADLAAITKAVLPLLGKHGLAWVTKPTFNEAGKFVLAYSLKHVSGEVEEGEYPLPAGGTPQEIGSAITYARRYCLCSVTGVAPESDDDDAAAASHRQESWANAKPIPPPRQQRRKPESREEIVAKAKSAIADAKDRNALDKVETRIAEREAGGSITADDAIELRRLRVARLGELYPDANTPADGWPQIAEVPE